MLTSPEASHGTRAAPAKVPMRAHEDHLVFSWRRRESNMGPVIIAEKVGAIRSVDSGEESGVCVDTGGMASAPDDVGASRACSNVASGTTPAALLAAIDAAIAALDAGETD